MVGSTVGVLICELTRSTEVPNRYFTWARSTKSTNFGSPTSGKVVLIGFGTSGGIGVSNCWLYLSLKL